MSESRRGVRGRFYSSSSPATVAAMDIGQQRATHQTGFRVVCEAGFQTYRGTSHSNLPTEGRRGELPMSLGHELLSFRLVREDA